VAFKVVKISKAKNYLEGKARDTWLTFHDPSLHCTSTTYNGCTAIVFDRSPVLYSFNMATLFCSWWNRVWFGWYGELGWVLEVRKEPSNHQVVYCAPATYDSSTNIPCEALLPSIVLQMVQLRSQIVWFLGMMCWYELLKLPNDPHLINHYIVHHWEPWCVKYSILCILTVHSLIVLTIKEIISWLSGMMSWNRVLKLPNDKAINPIFHSFILSCLLYNFILFTIYLYLH